MAEPGPSRAGRAGTASHTCLGSNGANRRWPRSRLQGRRQLGGPGAVYRGDGNWAALAGPAARPDYQGELGDSDWQVPLDAILQHQWIFESGYYRSLVDKAGLDNPTPLTSSGQDITLKFACVNRNLYWCQHLETHFVPNVAERTNGQVTIEVSSFPELGMAGPDTGLLLADGWVEMAEIYGGYVAREFPSWELQYLWGLWPDDRSRFEAQTAMAPSLDAMVAGYMDSQPLFRNWIADGGLFLFSDEALEAPEDFGGLKVRSFGASLTDWITGMGGEPQFISFLEISSRLGGHSLDAAAATANAAYNAAYGQRWYHVADYMNGPLYSLDSTIVAVSNHVWHGIPTDLQLILIEEGARHELESLRPGHHPGHHCHGADHWHRNPARGVQPRDSGAKPASRHRMCDSRLAGVHRPPIHGPLRRLHCPCGAVSDTSGYPRLPAHPGGGRVANRPPLHPLRPPYSRHRLRRRSGPWTSLTATSAPSRGCESSPTAR